MLSKRAYSTYMETEEFLMKSFKECLVNPFCKFENKDGIVNMGTAVNQLCEDVLTKRINQENMFNHTGEYQHYFGLTGTPDFLQALADFYTRKLGQGERVNCENIRVVNGVTSALEAIAWTICDPEDIILVPTPTYARFFADMKERMRAKVVGVNLSAADGFCLRPQLLEDEILKRQMKGERVKGIIFCNPQNPLGQVYSRELVHEIMRVCSKHGVHMISDEIYAMSVFDGTHFNSVLSFTKEEIPNPDLVHHLWGFSKDFGIAGFRVGAIHSLNQDLIHTIDAMGIFTSVSAHIQQVCVKLLRDEEWLENVYFPTNLKRLRESFGTVENIFQDLSVRIMAPSAGLFCWVDFSHYLRGSTAQDEIKLFRKFFTEAKVYIVPGTEFGCSTPGWFRIIFSVDPAALKAGLTRIRDLLIKIKPQK